MAQNGKVIHISDDVHRRLSQLCKESGISMAEWVEQGLELCLQACGEKSGRPKLVVAK
jgi:predicted HicB family RNase H-like nuclease